MSTVLGRVCVCGSSTASGPPCASSNPLLFTVLSRHGPRWNFPAGPHPGAPLTGCRVHLCGVDSLEQNKHQDPGPASFPRQGLPGRYRCGVDGPAPPSGLDGLEEPGRELVCDCPSRSPGPLLFLCPLHGAWTCRKRPCLLCLVPWWPGSDLGCRVSVGHRGREERRQVTSQGDCLGLPSAHRGLWCDARAPGWPAGSGEAVTVAQGVFEPPEVHGRGGSQSDCRPTPTGTTEGMRAQPEPPGGIQRDGPVAEGLEGEGAQPVLWTSWLWALAM